MTALAIEISGGSRQGGDEVSQQIEPTPDGVGDHDIVPTRVDRDRQLVEALRLREPSATERLVAAYGDRAYRLAIGITGNAPDAEEVIQDAFWSVIRNIDTFRGESAFGSWLDRIVANAAYAKLRAGFRRRTDLSLDALLPVFHEHGQHGEPIADWSARLDDPALQTEVRMVLTSAIKELPADFCIVLVLHDVEGWSNLEIAEALGLSVANVKARVHRARLFLRTRLAASLSAA
jgi:RNA polymerase sigma-70 factor (ECF subfamily)